MTISMYITESLEPKKVFHFFEEMCRIPHGSGNVDQISDYLVQFAKDRALEYYQDDVKNVIIIKEATNGYEDVEPVILQGHMDMVAVKTPDCAKDMKTEGLDLEVAEGYLFAKDTSLGGDDGIAVAMGLALMDSDEIEHPRLECIFTVDEEVGMDGANAIDVSMLKAHTMLNLDSEEEGTLLVSCAGGARVYGSLPISKESVIGDLYQITVDGLAGGHSGTEINKGRVNAACLINRILFMLEKEGVEFQLVSFESGLADNAIPRKADVVLCIKDKYVEGFMPVMKQIEEVLKKELCSRENKFHLSVSSLGIKKTLACTTESTAKIMQYLAALPNGVVEMSMDIEGLVETSLNIGIAHLENDHMQVQISVRSSIETAKEALICKLEAIHTLAGATVSVSGDYPGWAYRQNSPLRDKMVRIYEKLYGHKPEVQALHAGLECGLFSAKIPDLDCVSFGPDIMDIHTTEEKLSIESVKRTWEYVLEILKEK